MDAGLVHMQNGKCGKVQRLLRLSSFSTRFLILFPSFSLSPSHSTQVSYMQGVSVSASVNTLMAISIERCIAISCPYVSITSRYYQTFSNEIFSHLLLDDIATHWNFFSLFSLCLVNSSNRQYRVAVTMIWLIALSVNLPWLYVFQLEPIESGSNRKVSHKMSIKSKSRECTFPCAFYFTFTLIHFLSRSVLSVY